MVQIALNTSIQNENSGFEAINQNNHNTLHLVESDQIYGQKLEKNGNFESHTSLNIGVISLNQSQENQNKSHS